MSSWIFLVAARRVYYLHRFALYVMFVAVVRLRWLQQMVAVSVSQNTMLPIDEETTSSSQWPSAHLQQLNGWIRCKNKVLVRSHEHKDDCKCTAHDHSVAQEGNGCWSEHCSQVDPATDRWRQFTNALIRDKIKTVTKLDTQIKKC